MLPRFIQYLLLPFRYVRETRREKRRIQQMDDPILVFQMGKVGSTSVVAALEDADLDVLHMHRLTKIWPVTRQHVRQNVPLHDLLWTSFAVRDLLDTQRWKVISLVREPVSRTVSGLFQSEQVFDVDLSTKRKALDEVERRLHSPGVFSYQYEWFDVHLKPFFGVDVFAHPFDREEGYQRIQNEQCDLLVCQMEQLSTLLPTVISDFVGCPLESTRARTRKSDVYRAVKKELVLTRDRLDEIYSSHFVRHFYSEKQIETFKKRWTGDAASLPSQSSS